MVEAQLVHGTRLTTVLALVVIAGKKILAVEADGALGELVVTSQTHDAWHLNFEVDRLQVIFAGLFFQSENLADLAPIVEIIVRVLAIFNRDDLRTTTV